MNELITVDFDNQTVSAREVHKALGIRKRFSEWFETNSQGFIEGEDYSGAYSEVQSNQYGGTKQVQDYAMSVDMAKHICLMSHTERGKQCRQYLIDLEKAWNTPEQVFARALKLADKTIESLKGANSQLLQTIEEQKPLVEFANHVSESVDTIDMEEMAKIVDSEIIPMGRNRLIKWLKEQKILKSNRVPYQEYLDRGYFEVVEVTKDTCYGQRTFLKTVITGKGQIWVLEKLRKDKCA